MDRHQPEKKKLIIIAGATAVGKSAISIRLAKAINGAVISADSMQVYKGMDIGTAKITPEEMEGIPHYLIDEMDPSEPFNVFTFQSRAKVCMEEIYKKGQIPILVGGTGFYIQSVLYDIAFSEENADKSYRETLEQLASAEGPDPLYKKLSEIDPDSAKEIHPHNVKRVIRALEYYHETGCTISSHNQEQKSRPSPYEFTYFVLNRNRAEIYERINRRVEQMIEDGLVDEVRRLLDAGVSKEAQSMQGLGYKEITAYLDSRLTLEEAVDLLKKNTRHFAKRQITWFKREPDAIWLDYADFDSADSLLDHMVRIIRRKTGFPVCEASRSI